MITREIHNKALFDIHEKHVREILNNIAPEFGTLYHYTTLESAFKIIESEKIRFTNIKYLNDPSEIKSGIEIAYEVMGNLAREFKNAGHVVLARIVLSMLIRITLNFLSGKEREDRAETFDIICISEFGVPLSSLLPSSMEENWYLYIACFSERDDDLRQWIPYANNTTGCALGFAGPKNHVHNLTKVNAFYVKVCYESNEKKKHYLRAVLKEAFDYINNNFELATELPNPASLIYPAINDITNFLLMDLAACKNIDYADEAEWRLFLFQTHLNMRNGSKPNYFIKNNLIKPYLEVELNLKELQDIRLGPLCEETLNTESLMQIMTHMGYNTAKVSKSRIQYRG